MSRVLPITDWELAKAMEPHAKRVGAPTLRYISLGAGRQSTRLYIGACRGEYDEWGRPDVAIFADTQDEPDEVYTHLERLERDFAHIIPIERVTKGKLSQEALASKNGKRFATMPLFVRNKEGKKGILRRQCTREFKIAPIEKRVRQLVAQKLGREWKKGWRTPKGVWVESWQGISLDEVVRMKPSRTSWVENVYPLVLLTPASALQCSAYNLAAGYPAPKSACVFCPFTDDSRWKAMKRDRPEDFAKAVEFDHAIREGANLRGVESSGVYVHSSLQPLDEVDFSKAEETDQGDLFNAECEGMCGV